jgi:hypothetical protein
MPLRVMYFTYTHRGNKLNFLKTKFRGSSFFLLKKLSRLKFFSLKKTLAETRIEFEVQVFFSKKLEPRNLVS